MAIDNQGFVNQPLYETKSVANTLKSLSELICCQEAPIGPVEAGRFGPTWPKHWWLGHWVGLPSWVHAWIIWLDKSHVTNDALINT